MTGLGISYDEFSLTHCRELLNNIHFGKSLFGLLGAFYEEKACYVETNFVDPSALPSVYDLISATKVYVEFSRSSLQNFSSKIEFRGNQFH